MARCMKSACFSVYNRVSNCTFKLHFKLHFFTASQTATLQVEEAKQWLSQHPEGPVGRGGAGQSQKDRLLMIGRLGEQLVHEFLLTEYKGERMGAWGQLAHRGNCS